MPSTEHLEETIKQLAPDQRFSASYASAILQYNDAEQFEKAWQMLDLALAGAGMEPLQQAEQQDPYTYVHLPEAEP
jgi:hypothetical protein